MRKSSAALLLLAASTAAYPAPPPGLSYSVSAWAAPRTVERYQFHLIDLNADGTRDAVVYITDRSFCGGAGCPLLTFKGVPDSFDFIASSGGTEADLRPGGNPQRLADVGWLRGFRSRFRSGPDSLEDGPTGLPVHPHQRAGNRAEGGNDQTGPGIRGGRQ